MTSLEKIDFVFFYIKEKISVGGQWGYTNIWNYVEKTKEAEINKTLFDEIINKLLDDGLITEVSQHSIQHTYHVTFEGLIFEGYKSQHDEKQKLERAVNLLSKRTFYLTVAIAVGTGVAAVYYLLEILNHLFCVYPEK